MGERKKEKREKAVEKQRKAASIRKRIKALLGNECFVCGYKTCLKALELHHVDAGRKSFNISMNVLRYRWATIVKEVQLCVLVCNRCHSEIEEGIVLLESKDVPYSYYSRLLDTTKPARNRFKSKSYSSKASARRNSYSKGRRNHQKVSKEKSQPKSPELQQEQQ